MMALIAGIILTYGVSRPVAAANGAVALMSKIWFAIGGAIFLAGLWIFATDGPDQRRRLSHDHRRGADL